MEFMKKFWFQMSIFFRKTFHDFPKIFDKISIIFWQVQIDEIEKKMSKRIKQEKKK